MVTFDGPRPAVGKPPATITAAQIEVFLAIVDHGGVSGAARALGTSQPTLSAALARLERDVGSKLFERLPQGMTLNHVGRAIERSAREALTGHRTFVDAAHRLREGRAGQVTIGVTSTSLEFIVLPGLIRILRDAVPAAQTRIVMDREHAHLLAQVRLGLVDVAVSAEAATTDAGHDLDVVVSRHLRDPLVLVLPRGTRSSTLGEVAAAGPLDVVQFLDEGDRLDHLRRFGIVPRPVVVDAIVPLAAGLLRDGIGAAVLSSTLGTALAAALGCGVLPLPDAHVTATVFHRRAIRNPLAAVLVDRLAGWQPEDRSGVTSDRSPAAHADVTPAASRP